MENDFYATIAKLDTATGIALWESLHILPSSASYDIFVQDSLVYVCGVSTEGGSDFGSFVGVFHTETGEELAYDATLMAEYSMYGYNVIVEGQNLYLSGNKFGEEDSIFLMKYTIDQVVPVNEEIEVEPERIVLYPSPARDYIKIESSSSHSTTGFEKYQIINHAGNVIEGGSFGALRSGEIDISRLPAGHFYLKLTSGSRSMVRRFVKATY